MVMSSGGVNVACLGAGYFSRFHYDAWQRIPQVRLIGACDSVKARAAQTGVPAFDSLDQMLLEVNADVLDIITPPPSHAQAIQQAIAAGVRTIICQKPFCVSLAEATEAVSHAESSGVTLVIHENFRFQPWFRKMAEMVQTGRLGSVQQATFRLRTGDGQGRNAYMDRQPYFQTMQRLLVHETAVHYIDTFQFLFGPVKSVYADLRRLNPVIVGEDAGYIIFEFAEQLRALFDGNRHLDHAAENHRLTLGEALIEGTEATLSLQGNGQLLQRKFGSVEHTSLLDAQAWPGFGGDCVHALQSHVVSHLCNGTSLENTGREYLNTLQIEELVYRSSEQGQRLAVPA